MALEFLRVAMAAHGMTVPLEVVSACVCTSAARVGLCAVLMPCGKLRTWMDIVNRC